MSTLAISQSGDILERAKTAFFDNPRLFALSVILLVVAGTTALLTMSAEEDPRITNRTAVVLTVDPGASAPRVAQLVTEPLESALKKIEEVDEIRSTSSNGLSSIRVTLDDRITKTDEAFGRVRDALDDAVTLLPPTARSPMFIDNRSGAYTVMASITWASDTSPNLVIMRRTALELQDRLQNVPGSQLVTLHGIGDEEIVASLRPNALSALGLSPTDVSRAVATADAKASAGTLDSPLYNLSVEVRGEIDTLDRLRGVPVVSGPDGSHLRLGDIATMDRAIVEPQVELATVDGQRSVIVATRLQEGLRVTGWAERVKAEITAFEAELGPGLEMEVVFDQGAYAEDRFGALFKNLITGAAIVVLILFFTLGWRAALAVSLAIPLTGLATLTILKSTDVSINQISVTGLVVALGLLVDAAIVMTDAVRRQILKGISPRLAIQASIDRMFLPLLTSTLTTVLAFLPLATFPGPTGEFVGGIGKSVIAALSSSFVISLTAIATLAALLLAKVARRATESGRTGFWVSGIDAGPLKRAFQTSLMTSLRAPLVSILCAVVLPTCGFIGLSTLPLSFFPPADRNQINLEIRLSSPSSVARTRAVVDQADAYLRSQPEVVSASWFVGNSAPSFYYNIIQDEDGNANFAQAMVTTTNLDVIGGLVDRINAELSHSIPHSQVIASQLTQGPPTTAPIELRISGPDRDELRRIGEAARLVLSGIAAVHATSASDAGGEPKIWFDLDEDRAAQAGLSATAIARKIGESLNGTTGGSVIEGNLDLPVRLRPVPVSNTNFQTLSDMSLLENGERVPLAALGNFQLRPSAPSLRRLDGRPVNIVLAYLDTNSLPGPVIDAFNATWAASNFTLPPGCTLSFGGESEARADSVGSLVGQIGMIAVLTIALIVLTFRSFRLAAVVLVVAVLSAGLGFLSLTVFGYSFGFMAIIAIVGLIGVAINGAIIILSGLRGSEQAMSGDKKAITEEVMATSRHIWSTTLTTFGGFVPLMLSDSLFWPPFAVTIAGGILLSTTVNFYFVPQTFLIFRQIDRSRSIQAGPDSAEQVLT